MPSVEGLIQMAGGRPKKPLVLTSQERDVLSKCVRRPMSTQRMAMRCRIILACADGLDNKKVAERLGITSATVGKWRERFRTQRMQGLDDRPRPGPPRKVTREKIDEVIRKTVEGRAPDGGCWTSRSLAREAGLSQATIVRIWLAHGLKPNRNKLQKTPKPSPPASEKASMPALATTTSGASGASLP